MEIHVTINGSHVSDSPYKYHDRVYAEQCDCPQGELDDLISNFECPSSIPQIEKDLNSLNHININQSLEEAVERFKHAGSYSFCHYVVAANKVHSTTIYLKFLRNLSLWSLIKF